MKHDEVHWGSQAHKTVFAASVPVPSKAAQTAQFYKHRAFLVGFVLSCLQMWIWELCCGRMPDASNVTWLGEINAGHAVCVIQRQYPSIEAKPYSCHLETWVEVPVLIGKVIGQTQTTV